MEREADQPPVMPPAIAFVLTHRLPCAALMVVMLMAALWLPALTQNLPALFGLLAALSGLGLHMLAPALVALVTFGGGAIFAAQVAAIASLTVSAMAGFAILPGLVVLLVYGLLPIAAAGAEAKEEGSRRSLLYLALGVGMATLLALIGGAMDADVGLRDYVANLLAPMFETMKDQLQAEPNALPMLEQLRQSTVANFPGMVALGFWLIWVGDMMFARSIAMKYGFYRGSSTNLLELRFDRRLAFAFLTLLVLLNVATGDVQYVASNAAILLAGLLAAQGIAVGHSWLKAKGMILGINLMYLMLLIWPTAIVPFVVIGLLDIWFDFRRKIPAVGG